MARLFLLALTLTLYTATTAEETILSSYLTPNSRVNRQLRGYYDYRYARPLYDRLEYRDDRRCGRCDDKSDRSDEDDDDYDDRRHKPTSGKRYDKKDDDDGFDHPKNSTDDKDDKDRPSRRKHKNRYDDRDRYRPDYYDRFLRDPYRERGYDRPYRPYDRAPYDDPYAYRRPVYDRYDDGYGGYGPSAGRGPHESFRPWDETYRGQSGWDAAGRGYYFASGRPDTAPHRPDYSRPVESGWGGGGGGYSGYQDPYRGTGYGSQGASYGQNAGYGQSAGAGYGQSAGYGQGGYGGGYSQSPSYGAGYGQSSGYRDPYASYGGASGGYGGSSPGYGGSSAGYGSSSGGYGGSSGGYGGSSAGYGGSSVGYGGSSAGYGGVNSGYGGASAGYGSSGTPSGWHSVGERRPYRDESGVNNLDKRDRNQQSDRNQNGYKTNSQTYGVNGNSDYNQDNAYAQSTYGQPTYGKPSTYGKSTYEQQNTGGSTTAETSYLFQRSDENVTSTDEATKAP